MIKISSKVLKELTLNSSQVSTLLSSFSLRKYMYIRSTLLYCLPFSYFVIFALLNFLPHTNLYSCCFFTLNSSAINSTFTSLNRFLLIKYATVIANCHIGLKLLSLHSSFITGKHISSTASLV